MNQVKFKTDLYGVLGSRGYLLYVNKWGFFLSIQCFIQYLKKNKDSLLEYKRSEERIKLIRYSLFEYRKEMFGSLLTILK